MPVELDKKLLSWASEVDEETVAQARRAASLSIVEGHVALMPDAHVGIGATVGCVIPTKGAIIPSAVGVDIGCGMIAVEFDVTEGQLPDDLSPMLSAIELAIPAGVGSARSGKQKQAEAWLKKHRPATELSSSLEKKAVSQLGTLGSGNHFLEVCVDERGRCWIVLHSGSRGIGKELAEMHIRKARKLASHLPEALEDKDLAYFLEGTPEFKAYVADMLWAQDYARLNREIMMDAAVKVFKRFVPVAKEVRRINCHHNFAAKEVHFGKELWITRKGAIRLDRGELGVIPGSMGTSSFIVRGKGNPLSYMSSAHGAGRRLSRHEARRRFSAKDLKERMGNKAWLAKKAAALVDEIPDAYKPIEIVMKDQSDLVEIEHELHQVLNYKGT